MDFLNKIAEFLTVTVAAEPTAKLKEEVRSVKSIDKPSDSLAVSWHYDTKGQFHRTLATFVWRNMSNNYLKL